MTSRRNFLKKAVLVSAAVPVLQNELLAFPSVSKRTGLALYTIRDAMMANPEESLDKVAEAGYDWVEAANHDRGLFYGMKPAKFGKLVKKSGLELISTHSQIRPENADTIIAEAAEAGFSYLVLPSLPSEWSGTLDGFKKAADIFNDFGEKCRKEGLKFSFHNHQIE